MNWNGKVRGRSILLRSNVQTGGECLLKNLVLMVFGAVSEAFGVYQRLDIQRWNEEGNQNRVKELLMGKNATCRSENGSSCGQRGRF